MRAEKLILGLNEKERTRFLALRDSLADAGSFPECGGDRTLEEICSVFRRYEIWQFTDADPSVLQIVLKNSEAAAGLHRTARQSARRVLLDLAFEEVCGLGANDPKSSASENTLAAWRDRTCLLLKPMSIFADADCNMHFAERMAEFGPDFLYKFAADLHNADRRTKRLPVDMYLLVLARHWTDPHCPLWMMTRHLLAKVLPQITTGGSWTEDTIRKRIKKMADAGAKRFPGQLIVDVKFGGKGRFEITEFTIVGQNGCIKLPELEYTVVGRKKR